MEPQKGQCSAGFIPVGSEIPFQVQLAGCLVQPHMHTHLRLPGPGNPQSRAKNLEGQRWAPWQCLKLAHQARFCKPLPRPYAFDNCKERNQVCFAMADPKYPRLRASPPHRRGRTGIHPGFGRSPEPLASAVGRPGLSERHPRPLTTAGGSCPKVGLACSRVRRSQVSVDLP